MIGNREVQLTGCFADKCLLRTARLNVCVMLFVVMRPNLCAAPLATASAAAFHQYITKSAFSGTSGWISVSVST